MTFFCGIFFKPKSMTPNFLKNTAKSLKYSAQEEVFRKEGLNIWKVSKKDETKIVKNQLKIVKI